ncbi:growth hormone secretagogue receptor type 1 [Hydra vulgaris]|uniref:Growth hormone secretagogue receptor type 1 n=1 Tax=Hydra vulgaris TaxID=6087 RepID=A0ABM4CM87_HYDVU
MDSWIKAALVIDVLVIVANTIEIGILLNKWRTLDRIEHLLLSLSISDFLTGITMCCQDVLLLKYVLFDEPPTDIAVTVLECMFLFSVFASNFHVLAIAVERFFAVVFPMKHRFFTTIKCKVFTISFVWVTATILSPSIWFLIQHFESGKDVKKFGYYAYAAILMFACISVFIIYLVLAAALVIRKWLISTMLPDQKYRNSNTTWFCLLIGFSFIACFLPMSLGHLLVFAHPIASLLFGLNHFLNPFIYFAKYFYTRKRSVHLEKKSRYISRVRLLSRGDSAVKDQSKK